MEKYGKNLGCVGVVLSIFTSEINFSNGSVNKIPLQRIRATIEELLENRHTATEKL
jgi:hypothetical protein